MSEITFPITLGAFCEMAEQVTGEPVTDKWLEIYQMILPVINDNYYLGLAGEPRDPSKPNAGSSDYVQRFALSLEYWCNMAYSRGFQQYMGY